MTNDKKDKKAEEMSLEELLGHKGGAPTADYNDLDNDQQRNEAGSGLINLSAMVDAGLTDSKQKTEAPKNVFEAAQQANIAAGDASATPVAAATPAAATSTTAATPAAAHSSSMAPSAAPAAAPIATPPAKSNKGLFVGIGIAAALIIGGAVAFVMMSGPSAEETAASLAAKEAEIDAKLAAAQNEYARKMEAAQNATSEEERKRLEAEAAQYKEEQEAQMEGEELSMDFDESDEELADASNKVVRKPVRRTSRSTAKASAAPPKEEEAPAANEPKALADKLAKKKEAAPALTQTDSKPSGTKTDALNNLLSTKKTGGDSGGLPETPSRKDVQRAMGAITAKAKGACSSHGSGTVKTRIKVGSNGKIRDAIPLGEHATDSLGRCVSTIVRRTGKLPKFKKPEFVFTYPIRI